LQADAAKETTFDGTISAYLLKHRLVMTMQDAMNFAINELSHYLDEEGADDLDDLPHDLCLNAMASYIEQIRDKSIQGLQYSEVVAHKAHKQLRPCPCALLTAVCLCVRLPARCMRRGFGQLALAPIAWPSERGRGRDL
jgi:hypothetical protein